MKLNARILVISRDKELAERLVALLAAEDLQGAVVETMGTPVKVAPPDVVFFDTTEGGSIPEQVAKVREIYPETLLVGMIPAGQNKIGRIMQRQGVADYIAKPLDEIEFLRTLQRVLVKRDVFSFQMPNIAVNAGEQAKIITFFSTISGTGKSVLAINLAVALAKQGAGRICILDANLQFGDIGRYLCLQAPRTIADYAERFQEGAAIENFLSPWRSQVDVLLAPKTIKESERVSPLILKAALKELSRQYQYIIVDTVTGFNEWTMSMIDASSKVIFTNIAEHVPAVRKVRLGLDLLRSLGYGKDRVVLLLNRENAKRGLDIHHVEEVLETKFQMRIANDYETVVQSIIAGAPFVETKGERIVARQVGDLAGYVMGQAYETRLPQNWLTRKLAEWF